MTGNPDANWLASMRKQITGPLVLLALALVAPTPAFAALGGDAGSVARDREAMKGALAIIPAAASYQVHELTVPAGVVREYLAAGGLVFAVTWQGARAPDLHQLLGAYFERYAAEARTHRTGHHVLSIETPDFAASAVRLQRGFRGRAILPALLPAGVTRDELR
jgi:hypothetical protein